MSAVDERLKRLQVKKFLQVAENVSIEEWDQETSRMKDFKKVVMQVNKYVPHYQRIPIQLEKADLAIF